MKTVIHLLTSIIVIEKRTANQEWTKYVNIMSLDVHVVSVDFQGSHANVYE